MEDVVSDEKDEEEPLTSDFVPAEEHLQPEQKEEEEGQAL